MKILVPNSTAGMVIGKGGSYIQEIKEKTGAYVQISQKSREFNLLERCIVVAGKLFMMYWKKIKLLETSRNYLLVVIIYSQLYRNNTMI